MIRHAVPSYRWLILRYTPPRRVHAVIIRDTICHTRGTCQEPGSPELHPHPVRSANLDHPGELRIDLDPTPGVAWADLRRVALEVGALLEEVGLCGWPKTSGSRGMHVYARIGRAGPLPR